MVSWMIVCISVNNIKKLLLVGIWAVLDDGIERGGTNEEDSGHETEKGRHDYTLLKGE